MVYLLYKRFHLGSVDTVPKEFSFLFLSISFPLPLTLLSLLLAMYDGYSPSETRKNERRKRGCVYVEDIRRKEDTW
jgi:hypothetical protein